MSQAVNIGNTMKAVQPTATAARADGCRFIAADVGGTNARIALVHADTDGRVEILDYRRYPCATYPGLTAILAEFAAAHAGMECNALARMTIACAGVVLDEEVINSNLPWRIRLRELRDALGLRELHVINDFTAAAHGVQRLTASESRLLTPGVDGIDLRCLDVADPAVLVPAIALRATTCADVPRSPWRACWPLPFFLLARRRPSCGLPVSSA